MLPTIEPDDRRLRVAKRLFDRTDRDTRPDAAVIIVVDLSSERGWRMAEWAMDVRGRDTGGTLDLLRRNSTNAVAAFWAPVAMALALVGIEQHATVLMEVRAATASERTVTVLVDGPHLQLVSIDYDGVTPAEQVVTFVPHSRLH
jgi:hypothetical protein